MTANSDSRPHSWRREHKRLYWRVVVRWSTPSLDGIPGELESVAYRFPANYSESDAYEAAALRWDDGDWTPSEHERACRTYKATAKLVRACDIGATS